MVYRLPGYVISLLFLFLSGSILAQQSSKKPDILLIMVDDLGYHDVSYYGTGDLRTPNIDQLCRAGMRFDEFHANAPVCAPTRASLMTGRYPDRVGVPGLIRANPNDNWGFLDPGAQLLPAVLKQAGYRTALIGKWNLGLTSPNLPNERGFDHFKGWLEDMMDDYWTHLRNGRNYLRSDTLPIEAEGHATDLFSQWSVDFIRAQAADTTPFFLCLTYNAPHFPVQPPDDHLARVRKREKAITEKRARLVALIEHLDAGIGTVINALKASGRYENTLIIFTGDNGGLLVDEANNGPLRDGKQSMYQGGLKVPTFVTWPRVIRSGSVTDRISMTMDILPTLTELTGAMPAQPIEGRSFLPLLKGLRHEEEERPLYFIRREGGLKYGGKAYHALRLGRWKLLQNSPYQPMELYDLEADPLEKQDLIQQQPERFRQLNALLMQHIQVGGQVPWQRPDRMVRDPR